MEIVLLSSEPNPYELAFIYEMLIFCNFMTANCNTDSGFNRIKRYLVDFVLVIGRPAVANQCNDQSPYN